MSGARNIRAIFNRPVLLRPIENRPCNDARCRRALGFTLLEVLLTLGLMTIVLASLWSVFSVFSRLFDVAPAKAAEAVLVAGIVQQLSDDLQSAIEDSEDYSSRDGTEPVRRFGMVGTGQWLSVDVLQTVPEETLTRQEASANEEPRLKPEPRAPELRTVVYRCVGPQSPESEEGQASGAAAAPLGQTGLVRWESDFETPPEATTGMGPGQPPSAEVAGLEEAADRSDELMALGPAGNSATWVPEIVSLNFRYFDGGAWTGAWNSLQRKSLPAALEVTLQVREGEDSASASEQHRFVINLPGARSRPSVSSSELSFPDAAGRFAPAARASQPVPKPVQPLQVEPVQIQPAAVPPVAVPTPRVPAAVPVRPADTSFRNRP
jgi:hypothetical protein